MRKLYISALAALLTFSSAPAVYAEENITEETITEETGTIEGKYFAPGATHPANCGRVAFKLNGGKGTSAGKAFRFQIEGRYSESDFWEIMDDISAETESSLFELTKGSGIVEVKPGETLEFFAPVGTAFRIGYADSDDYTLSLGEIELDGVEIEVAAVLNYEFELTLTGKTLKTTDGKVLADSTAKWPEYLVQDIALEKQQVLKIENYSGSLDWGISNVPGFSNKFELIKKNGATYIVAHDAGAVNLTAKAEDGTTVTRILYCRPKGWQTIGGKKYYYTAASKRVTGLKTISGKKYYFDKNGVMKTGWQTISGKKYYFASKGHALTGWQTIKDAKGTFKFYLGSDGVVRIGWQKISNKWYYFDSMGHMLKGWQKIKYNNKLSWFYFDSNGIMKTGWQKVGTKWYYMNSSGVMQTGWLKDAGKWYYLNASGAMLTGWQTIKYNGKNQKFYFNASGAMVTGKQKINGKWYTFNSNGTLKA